MSLDEMLELLVSQENIGFLLFDKSPFIDNLAPNSKSMFFEIKPDKSKLIRLIFNEKVLSDFFGSKIPFPIIPLNEKLPQEFFDSISKSIVSFEIELIPLILISDKSFS